MTQEKNLPPTRRKLETARKEGDVAKSRELTASLGLLLGITCVFFVFFGYRLLFGLSQKVFEVEEDFQSNNMLVYLGELLEEALITAASIIGPILSVVFAVVTIAEVLQVGVRFTSVSLVPRFSRLNILEGLKRLLGAGNSESVPGATFFYEAGKLALLFVLLVLILASLLMGAFSSIVDAEYYLSGEVVERGREVAFSMAIASSLIFCVVGFLDLLVARKRRLRRLRMSTDELRREFRESEGDSEQRGLRKQLHQELLQQGTIDAIRRARVLVISKKEPL